MNNYDSTGYTQAIVIHTNTENSYVINFDNICLYRTVYNDDIINNITFQTLLLNSDKEMTLSEFGDLMSKELREQLEPYSTGSSGLSGTTGVSGTHYAPYTPPIIETEKVKKSLWDKIRNA